MKILLIYPPDNPEVVSPSRYEPLALEILASTVRYQDVEIFDMRFESYSSLNSFLSEFDPDIAGISINYTVHVRPAFDVLKFIRSKGSDIITVVGGHHPSVMPQDFYSPFVDYIFTGWAEKSFPRFVKMLESGVQHEVIPGVICLKKGVPVYHADNLFDLEPYEIPPPARSLTMKYQNRYRNEIGIKTALINTARGCPYKCAFCSIWKATRGHFVVRNMEDICAELESLPSRIHHVFFADDNTFLDINHARELCRMIRESGIKKKYSGYCRSDTIVRHPDIIREWKEIGLENLCVGFEGIDDDQLKMINKNNYSENNIRATHILHDLGLQFRSYLLIETDYKEDDFKRVSVYVNDLKLINPMFVILTPLPGTDLWERQKSSISRNYDYFDLMHCVIHPKMDPEKFYRSFLKLYTDAYSIRRHLNIFIRKLLNRLYGREHSGHFQHIPIIKLILLQVMTYPLRRKLLRQSKIYGL
jgi:radical SAM superfamily enzyme YgiQ (UPF0313 family)